MASAANDTSLSFTLQGAPDHDIDNGSPPPSSARQVMQLELSSDAIKDLQRSEKAGKPIALGFGKHMNLRYGTTSKLLTARPSQFRVELYEASDSGDSDSTMSFRGLVSHKLTVDTSAPEAGQDEAAADAALERMRQQYADIDKDKKAHQTTFLNRVVDTKQRKPIPANIPRSAPSLKKQEPSQRSTPVIGTPSLQAPGPHATIAGEAHRFAFLHLLAMGPASEEHIQKTTAIPTDTVRHLLDRYCEKGDSNKKESRWALIPRRFKELDVWRFPYASEEDRQAAVDNAIRALDKIRLDPTDKIWQTLLPKHERGKGKTLSRASLWPTDHRKMLSNIDGVRTPQADKSAETSLKRKDAPSDADVPARAPPQKVAKLIKPRAKPAAIPAAPAKGKTSTKVLSSERIDDSDEEFEQAAADEKAPSAEPKKTSDSTLTTPSPPSRKTVAEKAPAAAIKKEAAPLAKAPSPVPKQTAVKAAPPKPLVKAASPATESVIVRKRKLPSTGADPSTVKASTNGKASTGAVQNTASTESSPPPKRVKTEGGAPKPVAKAVKPAGSIAAPVTNGTAQGAARPTVNGSSTKNGTSLSAGSPMRNGTKASSPSCKSSTPPPPGMKKATRPVAAIRADPSAPIDRKTRYNSLVAEYNGLPHSSPRRKAVYTDIVELKNQVRHLVVGEPMTDNGDRREPMTEVPASHHDTLELYRRYYDEFRKFVKVKAGQQRQETTTLEQEERYINKSERLLKLQKQVIDGFESMMKDFRAKPVGRVVRADLPAGSVLRQEAAETASWKARAKFLEWSAKYEVYRSWPFGDVSPESMVKFWDQLGEVQRLRDRVLRSVALAYGRRADGRLEDVDLERVFR